MAGASSRIKTASNLTIPELKRWLSCRKRSKIKRPEADLVEVRDSMLHISAFD